MSEDDREFFQDALEVITNLRKACASLERAVRERLEDEPVPPALKLVVGARDA